MKSLMYLVLRRINFDDIQTTGYLRLFMGKQVLFTCYTLELPWKDNARYVSCIPIGTYDVVKRCSQRFGHHFHIRKVPDRSWILIHHGNYYRDTQGCILVGRTLADIDGDGYRDVTHSKQTMNALNNMLPDTFKLAIL